MVRHGRFQPAPAQTIDLTRRQITWVLWQTAAWLALAAIGFQHSAYAPAVALALAACSTRPRHLLYAVLVVPAALLLTACCLALGLPAFSAGGLVAGLAVGLLELGRSERWRLLNSALAGAALAPLALFAAQELASVLPLSLAPPLSALVFSLVSAQVLAVMAIRWREVARIPSRRRIVAALAAPYREPSLRALDHDRTIRRMAPDRATREGLGEVAAWVFRLSVSQQAQDRELRQLSDDDVADRIAKAQEAMERTTDSYARERRQATLRHLEGMQRHQQAMVLERERTESLVEYALATLEEARAGLAYAQRMPGQRAPEGLDEVLQRLRSHATEEAARRNTARELASASP